MKHILIGLIVFLSGCNWLQREDVNDVQLTSECLITTPDGTLLACRVGGSKKETATHDEKKTNALP